MCITISAKIHMEEQIVCKEGDLNLSESNKATTTLETHY